MPVYELEPNNVDSCPHTGLVVWVKCPNEDSLRKYAVEVGFYGTGKLIHKYSKIVEKVGCEIDVEINKKGEVIYEGEGKSC